MVVAAWKTVTLYRVSIRVPSIAQLVERRTVEVWLISLGRWFESGSTEMTFYFKSLPNYFRHCCTHVYFFLKSLGRWFEFTSKAIIFWLPFSDFDCCGGGSMENGYTLPRFHTCSFDSSVGRAEDCRSIVDILRSLVRIRLEGNDFLF